MFKCFGKLLSFIVTQSEYRTYFDSKDVTCYVRHEGNGGLKSELFASITRNSIGKIVEKNTKAQRKRLCGAMTVATVIQM